VLRHVMRGCARTFMLEILLAPLWLSSSTSEPYLRATLSLRTCICFPEAVDERAEAVGVSSVPALLDAILKDDAPPRPSPSKQLAQICISTTNTPQSNVHRGRAFFPHSSSAESRTTRCMYSYRREQSGLLFYFAEHSLWSSHGSSCREGLSSHDRCDSESRQSAL
jgi:hypothetical protein